MTAAVLVVASIQRREMAKDEFNRTPHNVLKPPKWVGSVSCASVEQGLVSIGSPEWRDAISTNT